MNNTWNEVGGIIRSVTGRRLVGTPAGPYEFGATELKIPMGSVEGAVHDLCHFVVASPEERRMPNMGLSQDWTHPNWDRMVVCEELAWALEFWLYGNPSVAAMASLMTPEARSSGGGGAITEYEIESQKQVRKQRALNMAKHRDKAVTDALVSGIQNVFVIPVQQAAIEELKKAKELAYWHEDPTAGHSPIAVAVALKLAKEIGLPINELKKILRKEWDKDGI